MGIRYRVSLIKNRFEAFVFKIRKRKVIASPCVISRPDYISIGNNVRIKAYSRIECYENFGGGTLHPHLSIGDNVIIGYRFSCLVADRIQIEKNTIIASDVLITSENHGMNPESDLPYYEQSLCTAPVTIGEGCWIGEKVVILPGVNIGSFVIIGAGAVVNKDIPSYSIAVGNPARIVKKYNFNIHEWIHKSV